MAANFHSAPMGPRSNLAQLLLEEGQNAETLDLQLEEVKPMERDASLVPDIAMLRTDWDCSTKHWNKQRKQKPL